MNFSSDNIREYITYFSNLFAQKIFGRSNYKPFLGEHLLSN